MSKLDKCPRFTESDPVKVHDTFDYTLTEVRVDLCRAIGDCKLRFNEIDMTILVAFSKIPTQFGIGSVRAKDYVSS